MEVSLSYNPVLKWSACHILISPNAIFLEIEAHNKNSFFLISILNPSLKVNPQKDERGGLFGRQGIIFN